MKKSIFLLLVFVNSLAAQYYYEVFDQNNGFINIPESFYQESDSVYWLGSSGSIPYFYKFNGDSVVASFSPPQSLNFYAANFSGIAQDTTGKLWICRGGNIYPNGIFSFNPIDTTWQFFSELNTNILPYPAGTLKNIIDSQNNLWVTHAFYGVSQFDGTTWTNYNPLNSVLTSLYIETLIDDDKDRLYFAPMGWISRKTTNTWTNIFHSNNCNGYSDFDNYTKSLFVTPNENDILVGTGGAGVVVMDSSGVCLESFLPDGVNIKHWFISSIIKDQQQNIWISYGSNYQGVSKYNGTNWEYINIPYFIDKIYIDKTEYKLWLLGIIGYGSLVCFYPDSVVSISENNNLPQDFSLKQNYPNPFNPTTKISFNLPNGTKNSSLTIFNVLGKEVKKWKPNNSGEVTWDGKDEKGKQVSSGIYFYQLKAENFSETKKMLLLK